MNTFQKALLVWGALTLLIFGSYYINYPSNTKTGTNYTEKTDSDIFEDNKDYNEIQKDDDDDKIAYKNKNIQDSEDYNNDILDIPEQKNYVNFYVNDEINKMFPDNYLDRILANGNLIRWHHKSFPLKVYVESKPSLPEYYKTAVETAFIEWQNAAKDLISFEFVADKNNADIKCLFPDDFNTRIRKNNNIVGLAHHNLDKNKLKDAVIEFASYINSKTVDEKFLHLVAVHEIGHALGLKGHSINKQDIMYPKIIKNQKITTADISTLRFLYSIIPDVSNMEYDKQYRDKFWTTEDILGDLNSRLDMTIQRMKDDIEITDNQRYNNFAEISGYKYYKNKNYEKAIKEYKNALKYTDSENTQTISYISYMIALCYYKMEDYNNALTYADYYRDKETDVSRLNFIAQIYMDTNNTEKAKAVLINTLNRDPKSYNSYILLGHIYDKEKNIEAFKKLADKAKLHLKDKSPISYHY